MMAHAINNSINSMERKSKNMKPTSIPSSSLKSNQKVSSISNVNIAPQLQPPQMTNAQVAQMKAPQLPNNPQINLASTQHVQAKQMPAPQMQMPVPQMQMPVHQVPTQLPVSNANRASIGGVYGRRQQIPTPQNYSNQVFNDDEPLVQRVKEEKSDGKIEIQIKAQRSLVKLKTQTSLPAMVSLRTSGGSRTSVDLICVIDNSGSMNGDKIELVKSTMRFLLETLTPSDRLSIVTFNGSAQRLCGLKCVSGENMQSFRNIVESIQAGGGTNINSGLQIALKTIRDRKFTNKVTSIFLLSDGQDKGAEHTFKQSLQEPQNKEIDVFTVHSFGFGTDHDEDLMTKLAEIKDGAFYFIKELATLDEAFCNALGGIISLVASEVVLKINNIAKNIVQGVSIKKVYGNMWERINEREYRIKLSQLMSGITKDFVFELEVPAINTEVGDINRDHSIIEGIFSAKGVHQNSLNGERVLEITLLNENEEIPDATQNVDVIENYLRVRAAEAIEDNLKMADQQKYEEAQKGIDNMIEYIQSNKKARQDKMSSLVNDLHQIREKCSKKDWNVEGRKWMKNAKQAHEMQNNYQYSNKVQSQMVEMRKAMKKS